MNINFSKIFEHPKRVHIAVGIVTIGGGLGLAYVLRRRSKKEFHEVPKQLNFGFDKKKTVKKNNPVIPHPVFIEDVPESVVITENHPIIVQKQKIAEIKEEKPEIVSHNVFAQDGDDWDYDEEVKKRSPLEPYVIHKDEFFDENDKGYTQSTFTYYDGDKILADEDDSPIYNHESVTGPMLFGHGSGDPNVFYVRNDKRKSEYEIVYDPGLFSVEVLGLQIENNERAQDLKHSNNRKFRME